jgi:hypothetical protein
MEPMFLKKTRPEDHDWNDYAYVEGAGHSHDVNDLYKMVADFVHHVPVGAERAESEADWAATSILQKTRAYRILIERVRHYHRQRLDRTSFWTDVPGLRKEFVLIRPWEAADLLPGTLDLPPSEQLSVSELLRQYAEVENIENVADLLESLLEMRSVADLQMWLSQYSEQWVREKRVAFAAVLEAAVQIGVPGIHWALAMVLKNRFAHPQVASIAAQRLRMVQFPDQQFKVGLWPDLRYWIDLWLRQQNTEEFATLALPSVPHIAPDEAREWLSALIKTAPPRVADPAVLGILDWARRLPDDAANETLRIFNEAILERFNAEIESERGDDILVGTLVWTLGATATKQQLQAVVKILVDSFERPRWAEDAAAVRAARLLYGRFGDTARSFVANAMGGLESKACQRYEMAIMRPAFNR